VEEFFHMNPVTNGQSLSIVAAACFATSFAIAERISGRSSGAIAGATATFPFVVVPMGLLLVVEETPGGLATLWIGVAVSCITLVLAVRGTKSLSDERPEGERAA
jgi:drug/metabolite transporter (DMT)-like permease